jgi:trk system potassium uptake protein TrkH
VTGPGLPPALKLLLCADMLLGRLEVLALLVLVSPRTWLGRRRG